MKQHFNPFAWKELWIIVGICIFIIANILLINYGMSIIVNATKWAENPPFLHPRYITEYKNVVIPILRGLIFLMLMFTPGCALALIIERATKPKPVE